LDKSTVQKIEASIPKRILPASSAGVETEIRVQKPTEIETDLDTSGNTEKMRGIGASRKYRKKGKRAEKRKQAVREGECMVEQKFGVRVWGDCVCTFGAPSMLISPAYAFIT